MRKYANYSYLQQGKSAPRHSGERKRQVWLVPPSQLRTEAKRLEKRVLRVNTYVLRAPGLTRSTYLFARIDMCLGFNERKARQVATGRDQEDNRGSPLVEGQAPERCRNRKIRNLRLIRSGMTIACDFGRWLHGATIPAAEKQKMDYENCYRLHAEFHQDSRMPAAARRSPQAHAPERERILIGWDRHYLTTAIPAKAGIQHCSIPSLALVPAFAGHGGVG